MRCTDNICKKITNSTTWGATHRNTIYSQSFTSSKNSNTYSSLNSISFFLRISKYSSLNDFLLWCVSWFIIYFTTASIWEWEGVNAPYPFYHSYLNFDRFSFLIPALLDVLISSIRLGISWLMLYPIKMWIWSGIELIASSLCLWFWIMPVIYISSSFFHDFLTRAFLFFTAKTRWK